MKSALFFTISILLVPGFLFGQDIKEKMRSIVDSYSLQDYQSEHNEFYNYKDLPGKNLNKAIKKYANAIKKDDVLIFHDGGVGLLGHSFIVTNDKLYYLNRVNPSPAKKSDEIKLQSITGFKWVGVDDNIYIYNGDKIVGILYMLGYNKRIAPILISLLEKIVIEAKQDAAKNYVAVPDSSWTLKSIQSNCPDIGETELCDESPFSSFTIRGSGGTKEDDGRWWWVNENTLGLSNFDSGNNKSGGVKISIREGYQVTLKFQFETKGDRNFLGEVFPKFKLNYNNYFDELGDDFFIVTMEGGDALHVDIDDEWSGISSFGLKVFGETIFNEEQKSSSIDDEVYISLIKVKNLEIEATMISNLERKNKDGHVFSFGNGKTKEEAIINALSEATKTMLSVLGSENEIVQDFDEKVNNFIKDQLSDHQVIKEYNNGSSTSVILSSIIPKRELTDIFQLKVQKQSGGMFAEVVNDNTEELEKIEYHTFLQFLNAYTFLNNVYDLNLFEYGKPIKSENYAKPIADYSYILENKIGLSLGSDFSSFIDILSNFLHLHADEIYDLSTKEYLTTGGQRGGFPFRLEDDESGFNKSLYPVDEGTIKYNSLVFFLDRYSKRSISSYGGVYSRTKVFKLKSLETPSLINKYINNRIWKIGFETKFGFTDDSDDKVITIIDFNDKYWEKTSLSNNSDEYDGLRYNITRLERTPSSKNFMKMGERVDGTSQSVFTVISNKYNYTAGPVIISMEGGYYLNENYLGKIKSIDVTVLSSEQIIVIEKEREKAKEKERAKEKLTESKRNRSNFELSTEQVICACLTSAEYANLNENACDSYINSALGFNWKTTNFSQNPAADRKFNQLASMCQ